MGNPPSPVDRRAVLQNALAAVEKMQARLDAAERVKREPIAIVGMGCRLPGGVTTPQEYWQLLYEGRHAVREIPADRWDVDTLYDADPKAPGKMHTRYGGFLDQVDLFDTRFFGISPREAISMDPQQRLLLEVVWEALEDAGVPPDQLAGSLTGVFVGITTTDYSKRIDFADPAHSDAYAATGNALNAAAGRISFVLGLQGPCVAMDTACSSSLVAIHLACQSLRTGESNLALAGGVNVILSPEPFILFSKWGMMAPDGRCKAFDAAADGFVRAEGCGVIVLKRLSDALVGGDRILALIRGSAVNQDGRSSGLTVPNGLAQQAAISRALEFAGIDPAQVSYVEAHGTGTSLGDPIEVEALAAVLGKGRAKDQPLLIGSVKTNLGHTEAASGVAGLMKVVLSLQHGELPAHLHLNKLNPRIPWEALPLTVPTSLRPWTGIQNRRIAGVSSFGFSGTNAHVVLEEAPGVERKEGKGKGGGEGEAARAERSLHVLTLSAKSEEALQELAGRYAGHLGLHPEEDLADVSYTANVGRAHFGHRLAVVGESAESVGQQLAEVAAGKSAGMRGELSGTDRPRVAFLFTGQGSQYVGMGKQLYETQPTFRKALERCEEILRPQLEKPLLEVLYPKAGANSPLDETKYTQPALFALEYGLAELWKSWGIEPSVVMGHSVGEYVAACVAGLFSLEDGLKLIATRGRLMQGLGAGGQMVAVFSDESRVRQAIAAYAKSVSIAAINGPENVVISGAGEQVQEVVQRLEGEKIKTQRLVVSHAFHSPLIEPMLEEFERVAGELTYREPRVGLVSNVTGEMWDCRSDSSNLQSAIRNRQSSYWRVHVREAVQFEKGMETLAGQNCQVYLEIGPSPVLLGMGKRCVSEGKGEWLPSLRKGREDWQQMLDSLGRLYVQGARVDWVGFDRDYERRKVSLPTYPFQRQRYWIEATEPTTVPVNPHSVTSGQQSNHPLLGLYLDLPFLAGTHVWVSEISTSHYPFLRDHQVENAIVVPATVYNEMAIEAAIEVFGDGPLAMTEIENKNPIILTEGIRHAVQVVLTEEGSGRGRFEVFGRPAESREGAWTLHVSGKLQRTKKAGNVVLEREAICRSCSESVFGEDFYQALSEKGNQWGACFQGVRELWRRDGEALSHVVLPGPLKTEASRYQFHPAWSDSAGHVLTATISLKKSRDNKGGAFVGGGIDEVRFHRRPEGDEIWAHARLREGREKSNVLIGDIQMFDSGGLVAEAIGARLWYLDGGETSPAEHLDKWFLRPEWQPTGEITQEIGIGSGRWLVLSDSGGVGHALKHILEKHGRECVLALAGDRKGDTNDGSFWLRPEEPEDFKVLKSATLNGQWEGIVHLWGLDAPLPSSAAAIDRAQQLGCVAAMHLVQQLSREKQPAKIWLVTRGAQHVSADNPLVNPGSASLWGFGRSLALEHTEMWGGLVDLDPNAQAEESARLLGRRLLASSGEDQLAFRAGECFVARLMPHHVQTSGAFRCRTDSSYLITGGLGGLGLTVGRWLAERGARRLILMGRTPLPARSQWNQAGSRQARQIAAIQVIESLGTSVHLAVVDVGDEVQLREFLESFENEGWPPIRGVIHAAGIMQYQPLLEHSAAAMHAILNPKVAGGWLLHDLLKDTPLEFFVLFSSASALLSSPMLTSYAAANAFLDGLAHYRQKLGLPALSINWGLWSQVGMGADFAEEERSTAGLRGIATIEPKKGLEVLERLLLQQTAQVGVIPVNWVQWKNLYPALAKSPMLSGLVRRGPRTDGGDEAETKRRFVLDADPKQRQTFLRTYVSEQVAAVLGLSAASLGLNEPITNFGLDSLMAVELKNRIELDLGLIVPMVKFLQGPSVELLSGQLQEELETTGGPTVEVGGNSEADLLAASAEQLLARLPGLSDDQVDALLSQMVTKEKG